MQAAVGLRASVAAAAAPIPVSATQAVQLLHGLLITLILFHRHNAVILCCGTTQQQRITLLQALCNGNN
jgi:hypothetical protein